MPAHSKSQQRLLGMVYAYKDDKLDLEDLPKSLADKIKSIADGSRKKTGDKRKKTKGISKKSAKDFASTKHEGLPEKVEENLYIIKYSDFLLENYHSAEDEEYKSLIDRLYELDELVLPNGAKGAVWLSDVISVIRDYFDEK